MELFIWVLALEVLEELLETNMENGAIGFIDSAPYVTLLFYIIKALHRGLIIDKNHNLIPLHINTDLIKLVHTIEYDYILFTNPLLECMQLI